MMNPYAPWPSHLFLVGLGKKNRNRRTEPKYPKPKLARNPQIPNSFYISISEITEPITVRVPEYIKKLLYTDNIIEYIFIKSFKSIQKYLKKKLNYYKVSNYPKLSENIWIVSSEISKVIGNIGDFYPNHSNYLIFYPKYLIFYLNYLNYSK